MSRFLPCMNLFTLWSLPDTAGAPSLDSPTLLTELRQLGFEGIQGMSAEGAREADLHVFGVAQIADPKALYSLAREQRNAGFEATNVIAGTGFETDTELDSYCDAIINASAKEGHPLYLETHRGSITQDARRTLDAIKRFPELRFTADLSHWYVGNDLSNGNFDAKVEMLDPLFERVRFVQGRVSSPTRVQVALDGPEDNRYFVTQYRSLLKACFAGFLATSQKNARIPFAPELLPASIKFDGRTIPLDYAYTERSEEGYQVETSNRWQQALWLMEIARGAFAAASG